MVLYSRRHRSLIPLFDRSLNNAPHFGQGRMNARGVLAGEFDDFGCIPDDVVLADGLKPKRLDADRTLADFRIPDKEAGREGLAFNLCPAVRINQKAEQILLSSIESDRRLLQPDWILVDT